MVKYTLAFLDKTFAALSDATRRSMVQRLSSGETSISELAGPFRMSLPAISKHIRILESAGLLVRRKAGRITHCSLIPQRLDEATAWITHYRNFWEQQLDGLSAFLERTQTQGDTHAHKHAKAKSRTRSASHAQRTRRQSL